MSYPSLTFTWLPEYSGSFETVSSGISLSKNSNSTIYSQTTELSASIPSFVKEGPL